MGTAADRGLRQGDALTLPRRLLRRLRRVADLLGFSARRCLRCGAAFTPGRNDGTADGLLCAACLAQLPPLRLSFPRQRPRGSRAVRRLPPRSAAVAGHGLLRPL